MFILDSGKHCFVWIGRGASQEEKKNGFSRAHVSGFVSILSNLLPRTHVSFARHQGMVLTKRHVGSGNEIAFSQFNDFLSVLRNLSTLMFEFTSCK